MHIIERAAPIPTLAQLFPSAQIAPERKNSDPISAALLAGGISFAAITIAYTLWRAL